MRLKQRLYTSAARIIPRRHREKIAQMLMYSGERQNADYVIGSAAVLGLLVMLIFILAMSVFHVRLPVGDGLMDQQAKTVTLSVGIWSISFIFFILVQFMLYLSIYFKVEDRRERTEKVLPDILQLVAANVKAGMTPVQALRSSARKEFGPISEEINIAVAKSIGSGSFNDALLNITQRIQSPSLDRAVKLFVSSLKAGGRLVLLLEELAKDILATRVLKKELNTSTKMYTMLIVFTIIIGAPLLQAVSIHFVEVMNNMQADNAIGDAGSELSIFAGEVLLTPDFLIVTSLVMLVAISILASMLIGVIAEGKEKYGLKYAPGIMFCAIVLFFIVRRFVSAFFGSML
ncbi:hypothetical protein COV93_07980 [Candidatus Woesearchaeota archaeon CG11_big_fil_rev_8_21_14_0_20_43_8]|nr:MAG: hypothetical protein COV93_07980 [Candidatus Woesearchaeota archaeon CG11_big_fil_rev_8_21_14_0_20_43_8]